MIKRSRKWHTELEKAVFSDPESLAAYEAFQLQYGSTGRLKKPYKKAQPTQKEVANRITTHKPVV